MIVITSKQTDVIRQVIPGDTFNLTVTDHLGCKVILSEKITVDKTIDYICSFRFALEDGTCVFHLGGFFGNQKELPKEMQDAVMFEDLSDGQRQRFRQTAGICPT